MAEFGLAVHTLPNGVRDEKKESIDKQKHNCLPLHNHTEHFAVTKIALPNVSVWMIQLAWGVVFATAYYKCAVCEHHLFIPRIGHKWEICKHYSHKYCCGGAGTVNSTLLALWCTSCSITQLSHKCLLYLLDGAFDLFQAVLSLLVLYRKKAIRRDTKQQFINIIQTRKILFPLRSCNNVWAT